MYSDKSSGTESFELSKRDLYPFPFWANVTEAI